MEVLPSAEGWASMSELPTHFYEFGSVNAEGEAVDLSGRKNSPTSTNTYNPVLTAEEAAKYNLRNVLGGTDSWLPTEETAASGAPTVTIEGSTLSWADLDDARCYVIFRDGQYVANVTTTSYEVDEEGTYTVRSANRNGGLGGESQPVEYEKGGGVADGIGAIEAAKAAGESAYNLGGQRTEAMQKGRVYIVGGKKVVKR